MTINLNTILLEKVDNISLSQLVLLSLVLDNNQNKYQDVRKIVSLLTESEIQDLISRNLIIKDIRPRSVKYYPTKELITLSKPDRDYYGEFKEIFPKVVTRPDGTTGYLHSNNKQCKQFYEKYINNDDSVHNYIMNCLNKELEVKTTTGKLSYMKTMRNWLTSHEWENYGEQIDEQPIEQYGTKLL